MAYGVKWFSEFADIDGSNIYRVEVLDRDFSGSAVEVLSGGNPVNVERMGGDDPYAVIRALKFSFQWMAQEGSGFEISDLFIIDDRKYRFRLYIYESGTPRLLFTGYLVFVDCEEPFNSKPYPVTFSATCSLPFVRDDFFLTEFGGFVEGKISLIKILANCLASTGLELPIYSHINLFEQGMSVGSTSPLTLAEIESDGLRGQKGGYTIEGILAALGAFIVQSDGRWYLKDVRAQDAVNVTEWRFDYQGNATGSSTVNQSASFGRTAIDGSTPNVFPVGGIGGVMQSIAEPNSIVTETVSPGIPVNRLANGTFSGAIVGGQIPGWRKAIEGGTSWTRAGFGTPDDPYRLEFHNHVTFQPKAKQNRWMPLSYFESDVIELNLETFYRNDQEVKDVKIIFSGALKMNNALGSPMNLNLNEQEREYADYMNENGDWLHSKKEDTEVAIKNSQAKHGDAKTYEELEYQTFDITSKNLVNQINIGGEGHIFIRLRVFPGGQFPGYIGNPVFMSYEDLSIVIYTGLVFEGEHKYRVDGKLQIRNPNEVEFTIIIADKIGIDTPENKRPENRVMTGYMTLAGGNTLTAGWRRYVNGSVDPEDDVFEPIQKKTIKERLRLYGGKRNVYSGSFMGKGLLPIHSVFNRFAEPGTPETFYTITDWKWDVKQMQFNTSFYELDFSKLDNEEVVLYDENSGSGRGNRGTASSSVGGSTSSPGLKPTNPILLDDPETIQYIAGKADTVDRVVDLGVLIQSGHAPGILEAKIINSPPWITSISIDQGENTPDADLPDEGILLVKWRGKPTTPGNYQIVVELTNAYGEDYLVVIPIYVNSVPKIKFSVLDTFTPKTLGGVPGAYKLPGMVDISATVTGYHNNFQMALYGPSGLLMDEFMYADRGESELQTYQAFPNTDGIVPDEGLYKIVYNVQSNMIIVDQGTLFFTLYTDEYLSKLKFELWNTVKIGDISIQDTSIFKPVAWFTPRAIIEDTEHDRVILTLYYEGEQIAQEITSYTIAPVMGGVYDVYDTAQTGQKSGKYRINAVILLSDNVIMERQNDFAILAKEPMADGTIKFGTMTANTANFNAIQDLPVTLIEIDLPDDGYNFEYTTIGGDYVRVEFLRKTGAVLTAVDVTKYTNQPDYTTVSDLGEKVYAFRTLSSLEIGNLHEAPSTVKVRFTERLGGAAGSILSIAEANVKFRVPVDPAELGGLNFIHINNDTAEIRVIDPNMKKVGNVYALPKMPWYWSVAFIKLPTNLEFDRVVGGLKLGGVELHTPGKTGVFDYPVTTENGYPGNVTTKLNTALEAFVAGTWAGTHRTLLNPSDVAVNIDVTGSFKFESVVARLGTPIAFPSAEFELKNEEDIEAETPEEEDGGCCEPKRWNFVALSVWDIPHNMDGYPEFNLIIEGEKWDTEIKYPDSNNAQAVWNRPRTGFAEAK